MTPESFPGLQITPPDGRACLLWDGDCGFCANSIARLRRVTRGTIQTRPVATLRDKLPEPVRATIDDQVIWIDAEGRMTGGILALSNALRAGGRPWLGALLGSAVVRPFARVVYRWIMRNRYRLPGSCSACMR